MNQYQLLITLTRELYSRLVLIKYLLSFYLMTKNLNHSKIRWDFYLDAIGKTIKISKIYRFECSRHEDYTEEIKNWSTLDPLDKTWKLYGWEEIVKSAWMEDHTLIFSTGDSKIMPGLVGTLSLIIGQKNMASILKSDTSFEVIFRIYFSPEDLLNWILSRFKLNETCAFNQISSHESKNFHWISIREYKLYWGGIVKTVL